MSRKPFLTSMDSLNLFQPCDMSFSYLAMLLLYSTYIGIHHLFCVIALH